MKIRVFTNDTVTALYLRDYIYRHPALEHFLDYSHRSKKGTPTIYLTNGSSFILGPYRDSYLDLGKRYDKYAEYNRGYHVPLDLLLIVIQEVVK